MTVKVLFTASLDLHDYSVLLARATIADLPVTDLTKVLMIRRGGTLLRVA